MIMEIPSANHPGEGRKAAKGKRPGETASASVPVAAAPAAVAATNPVSAAPVRGEDPAWVLRVWTRLRREPGMLVTMAYLAVSFLGLWASYWFYRGFGLPILDYMQPS